MGLSPDGATANVTRICDERIGPSVDRAPLAALASSTRIGAKVDHEHAIDSVDIAMATYQPEGAEK
jgi:hypothetical protein